jgi:hypothetical protein
MFLYDDEDRERGILRFGGTVLGADGVDGDAGDGHEEETSP